MGGIEKLQKYLRANFPESRLEPPLFYHFSIGIRFEIGVPYCEIDDPLYFQTVKMRSIFLFQEIFEETDEICFVVNSYKYEEPHLFIKKGVGVFPTYIRDNDLRNKVEQIELERHFDDDGKLEGISYQSCLWCKRNDIDYKRILVAIGYQDFPNGKQPYVNDGVYFINPKSHIIYHLYDDRGLDIVSNNPESLRNLYHQYNEWILDYDRKRIECIFNKT